MSTVLWERVRGRVLLWLEHLPGLGDALDSVSILNLVWLTRFKALAQKLGVLVVFGLGLCFSLLRFLGLTTGLLFTTAACLSLFLAGVPLLQGGYT